MANTRDIRNRIKSVKNTSQITRAMQLVAASKMKRAQDLALEGRPYATLLTQILASLQDRLGDITHPFLEKREVKSRGIIVISTDKGLCGPLNSNLFRIISETEPETSFIAIGRKGSQFLSRSQRKLLADFTISDRTQFSEVRPALNFALESFNEGKIDTIEVLFPHFKNTLVQVPTLQPILPLQSLSDLIEELSERVGLETPDKDSRQIIFEPNPEAILDDLLGLYIKQEIYQMILEAKASEHSARMVAMKTATDNAGKLVEELTLEYNKVRQAAITQEILEISAATLSMSNK